MATKQPVREAQPGGEIFRAVKDRHHPYRLMNTDPYADQGLSWEARGVLAYVLSRPDGWEVHFWDLVKRGSAGRDQMRRIMRELQIGGYLKRSEVRRGDGTFRYENAVYETPLPSAERDDVQLPKQRKEQPTVPVTEKPSPVQPSPANPAAAEPVTAKASPYNLTTREINEQINEAKVAVDLFTKLLPRKQAEQLARDYPQSFPFAEAMVREAAMGKKPAGLLVHLITSNWKPSAASPGDERAGEIMAPCPAPVQQELGSAPETGDEVNGGDLGEQWQAAQRSLREQLSYEEYQTWIHPVTLLAWKDGQAVLGAPNIFVRQEVECQYLGLITAALTMVVGSAVAAHVVVACHQLQ